MLLLRVGGDLGGQPLLGLAELGGERRAEVCRLEDLANLDLGLPSAWDSGQRLTHSIASSFDFTCHIQKPAISSLVSAKGPSITVRLAPENLTRAPFELGWRPSPASMTPALTSSSLNLPISASSFSFGRTPASESCCLDHHHESHRRISLWGLFRRDVPRDVDRSSTPALP